MHLTCLLIPILALAPACGDDPEETESPSPIAATLAARPRDAPVLPDWPGFSPPEGFLEEHEPGSPNAKWDLHWQGMAERMIAAAPGDGGGRAHLVAVVRVSSGETRGGGMPEWHDEKGAESRSAPRLVAGSSHRFEIVYEVGPHGLEEGAMLYLSPEAFWEWSPAQTQDPKAEGYVTARLLDASREAARLEARAGEAAFRVEGRALEPGERIEFVYGAGPSGARVDRYAERDASIMIAVDADGDGFRQWIDETAQVDIIARDGRYLMAHGPAEIAPQSEFEIVIALVDAVGNRARWPGASIDDDMARTRFEVEVLPSSTTRLEAHAVPLESVAPASAPHRLRLRAAASEGTLRLRLRPRRLEKEGLERPEREEDPIDLPPIVVRNASERLVWADLHGHSGLSDGTGTAADYFDYARNIARLDVIALTDHDHWGPRPLDTNPAIAEHLFEAARKAHEPGRFVTLPGYEWTSWIHGHRHVLYFDEPGAAEVPALYSSLDEETDRPDELWAALRGRRALTFAHHGAGEPVATDWRYRPDPELEPVTEIVSVHGQSESAESPMKIRGALPGYFALDALRAGYRLGFVGSGDSHDGHPGLAQIAAGTSGLAGIVTSSLERGAILDALRRRQTFATNGIRPWLSVSIDGQPMGATLTPGNRENATLRIHYEATAPIERLELVRSGRVAKLEPNPASKLSLDLERVIPALAPGEFHYVRLVQVDGGMAWSSPIFAAE